MFELFVTAFVMLFLVIDPIGLLPIFISLTHGNNKNRLNCLSSLKEYTQHTNK